MNACMTSRFNKNTYEDLQLDSKNMSFDQIKANEKVFDPKFLNQPFLDLHRLFSNNKDDEVFYVEYEDINLFDSPRDLNEKVQNLSMISGDILKIVE